MVKLSDLVNIDLNKCSFLLGMKLINLPVKKSIKNAEGGPELA